MIVGGISYITDRNGNPNVFKLERNANGLWLNDNWAKPDNRWNPENQLVFALRKYYLFPAFRRSRKLCLLSGVFCGLSKLFFHPQSILPISSILVAIFSYCLLEINFPSQAVDTRNLIISTVKIHSDNFSAFLSFSLKYEVYESSKRLRNLSSILAPRVKRAVFGI